MIVAIDYDGVWGAEPALFERLVGELLSGGHRCLVVTGRSGEGRWGREVREAVARSGHPLAIVFAAGGWKREAARRAGWAVDVWIDDHPETVGPQLDPAAIAFKRSLEPPPQTSEGPRWTVEGSATIHRDRWVCLRADDCRSAGGVPIAPYYVLEYPDWAHVLARTEAGRFLLVEQYRHGVGRRTLELPGGVLDPDESPLQAASRELREETGHAAARLEPLAELSPNPGTHSNRVHGVLALDTRRVGPPATEPGEELVLHEVSADQLLALLDEDRLTTGYQAAIAYKGLRRLAAMQQPPRAEARDQR